MEKEKSEVIIGTSTKTSGEEKELTLLLHEKKLIEIAPRVYTSNLHDPPEVIVRRNFRQIIEGLYPEAMLCYRSALELMPSPAGIIYLQWTYKDLVKLPGLQLRLIKGPGSRPDDIRIGKALVASSTPRALLENLSKSRTTGEESRSLGQERIEKELMRILESGGPDRLNRIRSHARVISDELSMPKEFQRLNKIISALLTTGPAEYLESKEAKASALGEPYDSERIELFHALADELRKTEFTERPEKEESLLSFRNLAFFEAYFSNFIEGTTFEIEEAEDIVFRGVIIPNRHGDSHDIKGTFEIISDEVEMKKIPKSPAELKLILKSRHRILMAGRPEISPGEWKTLQNRAGNTIFTNPSKVPGTLTRGFEIYDTLESPQARAFFVMFMVAEIHPFRDGNGRIGRVMMNAELVKGGQRKIIIPSAYRENYLFGLRALSKNKNIKSYIRMMDRIQHFSAQLECYNYHDLLDQLREADAFNATNEAILKIKGYLS